MKALLTLALCTLSLSTMGKKFSNHLLEFDLPPGWYCQMDIDDWVCQAQNSARQHEAIIIMSSKQRDSNDSIEHYWKYLKRSRSYRIGDDKSYISRPKYIQRRRIHGHTWLDALQLSSEVPGFYTRYMSTVKNDTGTAITFSVARDKYQQYQKIFDDTIGSLKFFQQGAGPLQLGQRFANQDLLDLKGLMEPKYPQQQRFRRQAEDSSSTRLISILLLIALAAMGFAYHHHRKHHKHGRQHPTPRPPNTPTMREQKDDSEENLQGLFPEDDRDGDDDDVAKSA